MRVVKYLVPLTVLLALFHFTSVTLIAETEETDVSNHSEQPEDSNGNSLLELDEPEVHVEQSTGDDDTNSLDEPFNDDNNITSVKEEFLEGDSSNIIIEYKEKLNRIGFEFNVSPEFDSNMVNTITDFQAYYGLDQTGTLNKVTMDQIDEILNSPLQNGKKHDDTIQLKKDLALVGFPISGKGTSLYGNQTEKKVKEFQQEYNLVVNGIADTVTLTKLNELVAELTSKEITSTTKSLVTFNQLDTSSLSIGMRSEEVKVLKQNLEKIGFKVPGNGTNYFGGQTELKVKEFQTYFGLSVTGSADEETNKKIDSIISSPLQKGKRDQDTIKLKKDLAFLGMPVPGTGTNLFGNQTELKVKEFQRKNKLVVNGIADSVTLKKIQDLIKAPLSNGMRREDVKSLKRNLEKVGFRVPGSGTNLYGKQTETKVREFQSYYGIGVTGIANDQTINKLNEILSSPLQKGKRHQNTVQLKKDLAFLGLSVPGSGTNLYGTQTENRVKDFQKRNNLVVNGIADSITLNKIQELIKAPLSNGTRREDVKTLKSNLGKVGFRVPGSGTNLYGKQTETKVREFQRYYGLSVTGIANDQTMKKLNEILSSPLQKGKRHQNTVQLKGNLSVLGFTVPGSGTNLYGKQTEKQVRNLQAYYGLTVNGIADEVTLNKIDNILATPLQNGKSHQDTIVLKENLKQLGFSVPGNSTNFYGEQTEKQVRNLQSYYGLTVNGIADEVTLTKIQNVLKSPLQFGKYHDDTVTLKVNLKLLGFQVPGNNTRYYGKNTRDQVASFQSHYRLAVSGIAEEVTLAKIAELVKNADKKPVTRTEYTNYNLTFNQALDLQMNQLNLTDKHRNASAYINKSYLRYTGSATIIGSTVDVRAQASTNSTRIASLSKGASVNITGYVDNGQVYNGSSTWYQIRYNNNTRYVHSSFVQGNQAVASTRVNVRAGRGTSYPVLGQVGTSSQERVRILNHGTTWHQIEPSWIRPTRNELSKFLNQNNNDKFQHLRLDSSVNVSAAQLNRILSGKGTLHGQGQSFINGARKHNINEAYLIAHAIHETGHGGSTLAKGVEVGKNSNGNLVRVTTSNRKNLTAIRTTYNMFGIGAADSCAVSCGAIKAYEEGWFSPKAAIEGGAEWIGRDYIHNEHNQNTLYKMKWNPRMSEGYQWKQYATDIGWAVKQTSRIKDIYAQLNNPSYHYDIPTYK